MYIVIIDDMKISDLKPADYNPRTIDKKTLAKLKKSLKHFGDLSGVVFNTKTGNVVGGHQRLKTISDNAKIEKKPASDDTGTTAIGWIVLESGEKWGYREVSWDIGKEKAANVSANNTFLHGDWDKEALQPLIADIQGVGYDLAEFNFDSLFEDLDVALDQQDSGTEDDTPQQQETSVINKGDLIEIGDHRLLCGDSTNKQHVDLLMNGKKADMVFTDPPYGVNIAKRGSIGGDKPFGKKGSRSASAIKANIYRPIVGDESTKAVKNFYTLCINTGVKKIILWGGNYYTDFLPLSPCWIIWDKNTTGTFGDGEIAWTNFKTAISIFKHTWSGLIKDSERNEKRIHPTQKPIALAEEILKKYAENDLLILDGFGGSGSTLIACEKTNRSCFMMEIDEIYCQTIIQRWCDYTGKNEVTINGRKVKWDKYENPN